MKIVSRSSKVLNFFMTRLPNEVNVFSLVLRKKIHDLQIEVCQNSSMPCYLFDFFMIFLNKLVVIFSSLLDEVRGLVHFTPRLGSGAFKFVCPRADLVLKFVDALENGFQRRNQSVHFRFAEVFGGTHLLRVFLAGMICQVLMACDKPSSKGTRTVLASPSPDQFVLKNVQLERFSEDEIAYRARAKRATVDRRSGQLVATEVEILQDTHTAVARQARGNFNQDRVDFSGQVEVTDQAGRLIKTDTASFYSKSSRLVSNSTVTIEGANFISVGQGLDANLTTQQVELKGPVKARLQDY